MLTSCTTRFIETIHYAFVSSVSKSVANLCLPQLAFFHSSLLAKTELLTPSEQLSRIRFSLKLIQRSFFAFRESDPQNLSILDIVSSFWRDQYGLSISNFETLQDNCKRKISLGTTSLRKILSGAIQPMINLFGRQKWVAFFLQFQSFEIYPGHGVPGRIHQEWFCKNVCLW